MSVFPRLLIKTFLIEQQDMVKCAKNVCDAITKDFQEAMSESPSRAAPRETSDLGLLHESAVPGQISIEPINRQGTISQRHSSSSEESL